MNIKFLYFLCLALVSITSCDKDVSKKEAPAEQPQPTLKALIIDGQNNHGVWPKTTMMMKSYLEETTLFDVAIYRAKFTYQGPHHGVVDGYNHDSIFKLLEVYPLNDGKEYIVTDSITADPGFNPDFSKYDVVISNFGMDSSEWSEEVKKRFEEYMKNGGGLVIVHAANNSFGTWKDFNEMIGVGGWGNRNLKEGNQIFYDDQDKQVIAPSSGEESSHGPEVEFVLTTRAPDHPIMKGLPKQWKHTKDELYDRLRGPAKNVTVLATAHSDVEGNAQPWAPENKGSGRQEPLLLTIDYYQGKIFHTALGHMDYSMESVGFITTFTRGAEWAATRNVTQEVPKDFPTKKSAVRRSWK